MVDAARRDPRRSGRLRPGLLLAACLGLALRGCATTETTAADGAPEVAPGVLQGFLPTEARLDSVAFLPPAPAPGSLRQTRDDGVVRQTLPLQGTARWALARQDARLDFPAAANAFSCALGVPITEAGAPDLYGLLRRTLADLALATASAKRAYQRARPFMVNGAPTCTPEEAPKLRSDGAYPSGHAATGWGWALILSELAPDRAEALLARGLAFGESRVVCNVHWHSDVVAGRLVGAAAVAQLHTRGAFRDAMAAAEGEIRRLREAGARPARDCAAEAAALAEMPP